MLVLATIVFFGCEKDETTQPVFTNNVQSVDETFKTFSQVLSYAVRTDADVRNFLKEEALHQIDGDYSVFYPIAREKEVRPGTNFAEALMSAAESGQLLSENDADAFFNKTALSYVPDLNILIPEYANHMPEDWNVSDEVPYVVHFTASLEDTEDQFIDGIDADGHSIQLAIGESPEVRTVVVGYNERILVADSRYSNEYNFRKIFEKDGNRYFRIESVQSERKLSEPTFQKNNCDRDGMSNREELVGFQFANGSAMSYSCPWIEGRCEFDISAAWTENPSSQFGNTLRKFVDDKRKHFKREQFYNIRNEMGFPLLFYRWDLEEIANKAKYVFVERDKKEWNGKITVQLPSAKFKLPFGEVTGFQTSVEIGYNSYDEELGEDLVYYCDEADGNGQQYSTGRINFRVTEDQ